MCGRYAIVPRKDAWAPAEALFGPALLQSLIELDARYNVAPSQQVPVIAMVPDDTPPVVLGARWGFVPHWWKHEKPPQSTINARSEEAWHKPMWRQAFSRSRCLVPATHWYEWMRNAGARIPHALSIGDGSGFMFAGLLGWWRPDDASDWRASCAILTRDAAPGIEKIHDRMPIVLDPGIWRVWIDAGVTDVEHVRDLLAHNAMQEVKAWVVSSALNSPRLDAAELLDPVPSASASDQEPQGPSPDDGPGTTGQLF